MTKKNRKYLSKNNKYFLIYDEDVLDKPFLKV